METVTREISIAEWNAMTDEERNDIKMRALNIQGNAVVRRADGSIKYDEDPNANGKETDTEQSGADGH